jgi:NitT/TauT family transport system substrate-binding protein
VKTRQRRRSSRDLSRHDSAQRDSAQHHPAANDPATNDPATNPARRRPAARLRALSAVAAALAVVAAAAACSSGSGSGSGGSGTSSLVVGIPPVISGADVYVAQDEGFFAKNHLSVSVKTLNGGSAIVPAMEGGSVQIGESNVLSVIQSGARGIDEPCFDGANTDPSSGHYLSLVGKSGVTSAHDLTGKTIAVNATNGVNQLLTDAYLASQGVDPATVSFISLQFPDMPEALSSGRVAAAMTSEPFTTLSLGQGGALLSATPLRYVAGEPTYSCWNAEGGWLSSNKKEATEFVAAMAETDSYIASHPAQFRTIASKHLTINATALKTMTLPVFTGKLTAADIASWEKAARQFHLLASTPAAGNVLETVP